MVLREFLECIVPKMITADSVAIHGHVDKFVFTKHLNKTTCQSSFAWVLFSGDSSVQNVGGKLGPTKIVGGQY